MVIAVDSVVYNMAGDEEDRPNYLKSLVARHMLSDTKDSMAQTINQGYMKGPAMRLRAFYRWAEKSANYGEVGLPTGKIEAFARVPTGKVAQEISAPAGKTVEVRSAVVEFGNPEYWAERYMLQNYPELYGTNWNWDYFRATNEVRIDFAGSSRPNERFELTNFDYEAKYIYAYYSRVDDETGEEGNTRLFIYKVGGGNADLNALVKQKADYGKFFPFIPVRLDNKFLSNSHYGQAFEQTQKAYDKATGGDLKELIEELKDNEDLEDIDHIYITFGVSLNTKENSAKKYIYNFFETLMSSQEGGVNAYVEYQAELEAYKRSVSAWDKYQSIDERMRYNFKDKKKVKKNEPKRLTMPKPLSNRIIIRGTGDINSSYHVKLKWNYIRSYERKGRGKVGAKPNDIWFKAETFTVAQERMTFQTSGDNYNKVNKPEKTTRLKMFWQKTRREYVVLEVVGAEYENTIYKGKSVKITPKEALNDSDESGFIVPIHYNTWLNMRLTYTTQMSTACVYAVFNCYQERKRKWYETGIFRIFLVIVIAVASVIFTGGAGFGLLGAHLSIGTAFGLSGMSAAILGSVVNAMAALVLTTVIEKMTASLGMLGPIVGFLLGAMVGQFMSAVQTGAFNFNWSSLLNVDNLLKLTQAVGNTFVAAIQEDTLGIQQKWMEMSENAETQSSKIQQAYFEEFGYGAGAIDPMMLLEQRNDFAVETSSTFLTRTLMTGSEIAEMSRELLYDFPKYSLELPDAFSS